jgi:hypothetical protein
MVSRLASGGIVWQGHQHSISNVHRREKVDRRGARGSSSYINKGQDTHTHACQDVRSRFGHWLESGDSPSPRPRI